MLLFNVTVDYLRTIRPNDTMANVYYPAQLKKVEKNGEKKQRG